MNIEINLLPWRDIHRKNESKKIFIFALAGLAVLSMIFLSINSYINGLVEKQLDINQGIRNEIELLHILLNKIKKIKNEKSRLIDRISLLQKLENNSVLVIHLFDELGRLMPEEVYLNQIKGVGNRIVLRGYSDSSQTVSLLMQKIENNAWMSAPNLLEIKNENEQTKTNSFTLHFTLKPKQIEGLN